MVLMVSLLTNVSFLRQKSIMFIAFLKSLSVKEASLVGAPKELILWKPSLMIFMLLLKSSSLMILSELGIYTKRLQNLERKYIAFGSSPLVTKEWSSFPALRFVMVLKFCSTKFNMLEAIVSCP